jgi:hypothetical protein
MVEHNFSKRFLTEIVPKVDWVVVSFATKSLVSKKSFSVKRYWFDNFLTKSGWKVIDNFEIGYEKYIVFSK